MKVIDAIHYWSWIVYVFITGWIVLILWKTLRREDRMLKMMTEDYTRMAVAFQVLTQTFKHITGVDASESDAKVSNDANIPGKTDSDSQKSRSMDWYGG